MHSLGIAQDILKVALREADSRNAAQVSAISLKIADEHLGEESEYLRFCLEAASKGTIAEGVKINIELTGAAANSAKIDSGCPHCHHHHEEDPFETEPLEITLELQ